MNNHAKYQWGFIRPLYGVIVCSVRRLGLSALFWKNAWVCGNILRKLFWDIAACGSETPIIASEYINIISN